VSDLKQRITEDMKAFMRARDKENLEAIRLLIAKIKQKEIDERIECTDQQVTEIIIKMVKQGKEAKAQFESGDRPELAQKEARQIEVFSKYLPEQISEEELEKLVEGVISELGASSMQQMGQVMGILKPKCQGKADMGLLSKLVKTKLSA
jgi:uncharacterized protein